MVRAHVTALMITSLETRHYAFIVAVLTSHLTLVVALDLLEHRLYYSIITMLFGCSPL